MDLLERLVDNSLLVRLPVTAEQMRFTLLETLREYALELLKARGECERMRDWHAFYYLTMAEEAEIGLRGAQQLVWRSRLVVERDNLRAALDWSLQRARAGACLIISDPDHLPYASTGKTTCSAGRSGVVRPRAEVLPDRTGGGCGARCRRNGMCHPARPRQARAGA